MPGLALAQGRQAAFANRTFLLTTDGKIPFVMEVNGLGFGTSNQAISVGLLTETGEDAAENVQISVIDDRRILFTAQALQGKYKLNINGAPVDTTNFPITLKAAPPVPNSPKEFEIKFKTFPGPYPNSWTLLLTSETNSISANRNQNQVSLIPAGASNIDIEAADPRQIILTFMAPDKFEVKDVVVTVYDSSDPDARQPVAMSKPSKEKQPPVDPNQPTIAEARQLFLDRSRRFGFIAIRGTGFGHTEDENTARESRDTGGGRGRRTAGGDRGGRIAGGSRRGGTAGDGR